MTLLLTLLFFLQPPQEVFTSFTYCRDYARGVYEAQCLDIRPDGSGDVRFKRRNSDENQIPLSLSTAGRDRVVALLAATNYLAGSADYESKRKVADLGRKRLSLEMPAGRRSAEFNYSEIKEVNQLATFCDALLNRERIILELDTALRVERLSVPERLDQIEKELRANQISDPKGLIAILEKVEQDQRVMNYARSHAQQLKARLAAEK